MPAWLGAACGALVTGLFALLMWILNRKAAKNDKRDAKKDAEDKALMESFKEAINLVRDVAGEIGVIKADLVELKENNRAQDAARALDKALEARRRILQFADEIRRGIKHSMEHFNNILEDITSYKDYCRTHEDFQNDKAVRSIQRIEEVFDESMRNNDFL